MVSVINIVAIGELAFCSVFLLYFGLWCVILECFVHNLVLH